MGEYFVKRPLKRLPVHLGEILREDVGSLYKTVQVNNFNKLRDIASGSTWQKIRCLQDKTG